MDNKEIFLYKPQKKDDDAIKVWFSFPCNYNIGMSALGYLHLFRLMDENPKTDVERIFTDTERSRHNLKDVDVFGFSFSFELDFLNIFKILQKYNIPLKAKDRDDSYPLIFAGGPVLSVNPEPFSDFFDFILVGDGEVMMNEAMNFIQDSKGNKTKAEILEGLASIEGVYVPSLYNFKYDKDGAVSSVFPNIPVKKRVMTDMSCVFTPIITENTMFSNNCLIELYRGCPNRCAFCLSSYLNLPPRYPSFEEIKDIIDMALANTNKIGLLGALVSAHPKFDQICDYILEKKKEKDFEVSISSLRADRLSAKTVKMLTECHQRSSTIAMEAGSQRLRQFINKNLSDDQIAASIKTAAENGLKALKIYAMIGLPEEEDKDIENMVTLVKNLQKENKDISLTLSTSSFVPKAQTPFQWYGREEEKILENRNNYLKKHLHISGIKYRPTSIKWDEIQAVISRGDRRLSDLLIKVYEYKASLGSWHRAYKELSETESIPPLEFYSKRKIPFEETLPWDLIENTVSKQQLVDELKRLQNILYTSSGK